MIKLNTSTIIPTICAHAQNSKFDFKNLQSSRLTVTLHAESECMFADRLHRLQFVCRVGQLGEINDDDVQNNAIQLRAQHTIDQRKKCEQNQSLLCFLFGEFNFISKSSEISSRTKQQTATNSLYIAILTHTHTHKPNSRIRILKLKIK